ncbi:MAG: hypothetical protein WBQ94_03290, partial [Terracidiphilus sp.]
PQSVWKAYLDVSSCVSRECLVVVIKLSKATKAADPQSGRHILKRQSLFCHCADRCFAAMINAKRAEEDIYRSAVRRNW